MRNAYSRRGLALALGCGLAGWATAGAAQEAEAGDQPPACASEWIGGTAALSRVSGSEVLLREGVSLRGDEAHSFAFRVADEGADLRLELHDPDGNGDPLLTLLDSQANELDVNDDFGGTLSSRIDRHLEPGDYCVHVTAVAGSTPSQASLQIATDSAPPLFEALPEEETSVAETIPACVAATPSQPFLPAALNADALEQGALSLPVEVALQPVYLRFSVEQPSPLTLRATSTAVDPMMTLFDAQGAELAHNDDSDDGLNARLDFPAGLPAGEYCLGVTAYETANARTGQIEVQAQAYDQEAEMRALYDRAEIAPPTDGSVEVETLDLGETRELVTLGGTTARWFRFTVDRRMAVMIAGFGTGPGTDARLKLFAAGRQMVAENDDANGTLDPQIGPLVLQPGDYDLAVLTHGSGGQGLLSMRPIRLTFERFFPEE
ncbi:MAG: DVUA0089 family protein [Paracoccus sp. (in: a-proteobacteria)]|uniref:DVUA0089 family protein n=1 Tax=Paracoccus sp. TaxID=267 RepID=UPI0026DECA83|nr:DVUA0089 family protein [Paracoccus sp. (in: a-proteobacteria)]MDO5612046.1 DVUA0089 family protein [Paracoccus sp. (in: a-proteobacteria)]